MNDNIRNSTNRKKKLITAVTIIIAIVAAGCLCNINKCTQKSIFAMDTYMELTAYGFNSEKAVDEAIDEITRLDKMFSTGDAESEITKLNTQKNIKMSDEVLYLFDESKAISEATNGAFDITIYPIMRAWGFGGDEFRVPSTDELDKLIKNVDYRKIKFDIRTNEVELPNEVEVDFGGIAKGYTSSRVADIMRKNNIKSAILNLGGNVQAVGTKPDGSKWKVAVKSPDDSKPYIGVLQISDKCVITSGGYERFFEQEGIVYHHIINPKNGMPANNGLVSVTIVSDDGTKADALSTALFVMGKEKAIDYWKQHKTEFDIILVDDENNTFVSDGIKDSFTEYGK